MLWHSCNVIRGFLNMFELSLLGPYHLGIQTSKLDAIIFIKLSCLLLIWKAFWVARHWPIGKTPVRIILWCPTTKMLIKACFLIQSLEQEGGWQKCCISLCSNVFIYHFLSNERKSRVLKYSKILGRQTERTPRRKVKTGIFYQQIYRLCHYILPWWRHQMETFSTLLAFCAGNSPVTGEFPSQRPVTRSFDVFFDLRLNKRLSKQSRSWWFETPSLWCHCYASSCPYWLQRS